MVHRPADSRLLTNLLSHEKDYSKQLSILLDYSQATLASLSAYAAASAPPTSQVIIAVAGALSGADDALRNYAAAVERWQEQLRALKAMEDDVGNIMRDREILVTRLIKASKQQKPTRDSMLNGSPSGSSLSIAKPEVQVGQKMSAAQAELQACEAHLATKEQELNAFRTNTIRSGLHARCKAMVECGWAWGEMGKEGIRALDTLDMPNGHGSPAMHPYLHLHKPLPGFEKASSDVSSIAPSQSASQNGASPPGSLEPHTWRASPPPAVATPSKPYTFQIPPAHSITDFALPNVVANSTILEETGGSSAEDEDERPVEVHVNPRFNKGVGDADTKVKSHPKAAPPSRHISFSLRTPKGIPSDSNIPLSYSLRSESPSKKRGVLGSLAGLFHIGNSRGASEDSPNGSPSKQGRWHTRIDRNLASARGGKGDGSSDDEVSHTYAGPSSPRLPVSGPNGDAKLKKRTMKRSSVQTQPASRMVADTEKGYASDTVTESMSKSRAKTKRQNSGSKRVDGFGGSVRVPNGSPVAGSSGAGRLKKSPAMNAILEGETSLSRNSSLSKQSVMSAASAPPRMNPASAASRPGPSPSSPPRKRTASLDVGPSTPKAGPSTPGGSGHKRTVSTSATPTPTSGEPSLMTIVEGISRLNKQVALHQDPNRLLVVPKAPGPINIALSESLGELPVIRSDSSPPKTGSPTSRPRKNTNGGKEPEGNTYRNSLLLSASMSAPSLHHHAPTSTASPGQSKPLPPLRSALRNPSRTPSPNPPPKQLAKVARAGSPSSGSSGAKSTPVLQHAPAPSAVSAAVPAPTVAGTLTAERPPMKRQGSDISSVSSISSYETGHETFESEPDTPVLSSTPMRAPSPPHAPGSPSPASQPTTQPDGHAQDGSELSHSTGSTILSGPANGDQPPRRRKSVRMSLPPTFSATPPAIEDTDEDDAAQSKHAPWSSPGGGSVAPSSWGTRIEANGVQDVWEDSSDEDVEYSMAKKMLTRFSRKHEH
ncbi:hypothetical protein L226DRAFT_538821 [Lentinus tigrinus ALCF2SS1-7]|uniref:Uncharacterized protein n=1 Tax=Lentinus tigrinus ALCF2SS1-6 TaxID=1328759 RepID=A0A5C2RQM9_9APHY|nr:hypothetical protein L227DRAFT_604360 [Lentinus tigrinus ALCF2SS1-6]RPD70576.1 hypothetical protein L226DRAFT_538821 [Lentinus tigrinus ALCF2SS1-7]